MTLDGRQVTELTALIPLAKLLSPKEIEAFDEARLLELERSVPDCARAVCWIEHRRRGHCS
jgi:hypothetical protein